MMTIHGVWSIDAWPKSHRDERLYSERKPIRLHESIGGQALNLRAGKGKLRWILDYEAAWPW